MVSSNERTPAKLPFEVLTDTLKSIQQDVQALSACAGTLQHTHRVVVRAMLGLAAGMVLCIGGLFWWTKAPATPNYTPAFFAIDTVLVDTWKSLPKDLQGKLDLAYRAGQVRAPADRK